MTELFNNGKIELFSSGDSPGDGTPAQNGRERV